MNLKLKNITKYFGNKKILDNISFEVTSGELFTVLGESGAGKSTILKIIAGLTTPDFGEIYIDDRNITKLLPEERRIPYIFQQPLLFPHMTVKKNIAFSLEVMKVDKKQIEERVNTLMELLKIRGLGERMPSEISGGQQQRVSLGRALAAQTSILLMDEPFSGLHTELRQEMGKLIKSLKEELKLTILLVTHDRNEALILSDRIALLKNEAILQIGTSNEIYYKPISKEVAVFMGKCNFIPQKVFMNIIKNDNESKYFINSLKGNCEYFFRPHQIKLVKGEKAFTIVEIENLGKEKFIKVKNEVIELLIETYSNENFCIGDKIGVDFYNKDYHLLKL